MWPQPDLLEWQKLKAVGEVLGLAHFGDEFEIVYTASHRDLQFMRIDDPGERNPAALAPCRLGQQVLVLTEKHTTERRRAVEQFGILNFGGIVCLSREDIHTPFQQRDGYCSPDMDIHVQRETHGQRSLPSSLIRF
jgi:hypothetical protein